MKRQKKKKPVAPSRKSLVALAAEAFVDTLLRGQDSKCPGYTLADFSYSTVQLVLEVAKSRSWSLATNTLFFRALSHYGTLSEGPPSSSDVSDYTLWKIAYETVFHRNSLPPSIRGSLLQSFDTWCLGFMQTMVQRNLDFIAQRNVPGEPVRTKDFQDFVSRMEEFFAPLPNRSLDISVRRSDALSVLSLSKVFCPKICGIDASETESDLSKANVVPIMQLFPNLICLCLRNVKLRHAGLSALLGALSSSGSSHLLTTLNISNCNLGVADACTEIVKLAVLCPNLKHLDISMNPLHDTGILAIASSFANSKALRTLDVTGCNCSPKGLSSISSLLGGGALRLYAGANRDLYNKGSLGSVAEMFTSFGRHIAKRTTPVISLDASGEEPITSARIAELNALGKDISPPLGTAHLSGLLGSLMSIMFRNISFSALHKLTLDGVPLAQDAVSSIAEAIDRGGLSALSVSGCCLSADSIRALFCVVCSGHCSALNLSGNKPMVFPVDSLLSALASPASELARLNIGSCGISDKQARQIFSVMATHGKSIVSLIMSANNLGPGCELGISEMLSQNNTLTDLDLSENSFTFAKLAGVTGCNNQVLSKLDVSYNPRAKASILDFVCDNLLCLTHIRALRRSSGTSRLWNDSTVKLLRTHPAIEDVVISCPTAQAINPIVDFLCNDADRLTPLRLCVNVGYDAAFCALENVSRMDTLTELMLMCSQPHILELAKHVPQPCGTKVRLIPSFALELGFPTWSQYPLPPYPLIYRNSYEQNPSFNNEDEAYLRPPEEKLHKKDVKLDCDNNID